MSLSLAIFRGWDSRGGREILQQRLWVCSDVRRFQGGNGKRIIIQLKIETPTFATNISACFYFTSFFPTCFGPDQWPSSGDIV
jgi:hypothetical protein